MIQVTSIFIFTFLYMIINFSCLPYDSSVIIYFYKKAAFTNNTITNNISYII